MIAFIAKLVIKEGKEKEFERLQGKLAKITLAEEPDTWVYDFIRHRDHPRTYIVYSSYKDQAALDRHMKAPAHDELVPPIMECLAEDMDLQFFDGVEFTRPRSR